MWSSSPRVPYGTGVVQAWRFLSSVSEMCVGAERLASWTSQGVFCVKFVACSGFTCSFLRRTCGEKQSLCDVLVWRIEQGKVYENYSDIGGFRCIRWVLTCFCGRSGLLQIKVSTGMHRSTNNQSGRTHC